MLKCPRHKVVELTTADRFGVEIDYRSAHRGIWLSRDELDRVVERIAEPIGHPDQDSEGLPFGFEREQKRFDDDDDHRKRLNGRGALNGEIFGL